MDSPATAPTISPAKYRQASTAVFAPWVVREPTPDFSMAKAGSAAYARGRGDKAHKRPVPRGPRVFRSAIRLIRLFKPQKGPADRISDVETRPRTGQMPLSEPPHVALQLVHGIEALFLNEAFRQTKRHGRIVPSSTPGEARKARLRPCRRWARTSPGGLNSRVVPKASPTASPKSAPRYRSTGVTAPLPEARRCPSPSGAPCPFVPASRGNGCRRRGRPFRCSAMVLKISSPDAIPCSIM